MTMTVCGGVFQDGHEYVYGRKAGGTQRNETKARPSTKTHNNQTSRYRKFDGVKYKRMKKRKEEGTTKQRRRTMMAWFILGVCLLDVPGGSSLSDWPAACLAGPVGQWGQLLRSRKAKWLTLLRREGAKSKVEKVTLLSLNNDQNRPNNNTYTLTTTKIDRYRSNYIQTATHRRRNPTMWCRTRRRSSLAPIAEMAGTETVNEAANKTPAAAPSRPARASAAKAPAAWASAVGGRSPAGAGALTSPPAATAAAASATPFDEAAAVLAGLAEASGGTGASTGGKKKAAAAAPAAAAAAAASASGDDDSSSSSDESPDDEESTGKAKGGKGGKGGMGGKGEERTADDDDDAGPGFNHKNVKFLYILTNIRKYVCCAC
jgi:hypothetical protein